MLNHSLGNAVEVANSEWGQVCRVWASEGIKPIDHSGNGIDILVVWPINFGHGAWAGVLGNFNNTVAFLSFCPHRVKLVFDHPVGFVPLSQELMMLWTYSPSGSCLRSRAALSYVILASRAKRPALASMPSAIWMSPKLSGSSASTFHVEKTAEEPSTPNSSLASFRISTHGSAGSLTGKGAWVSRSIENLLWGMLGHFCKYFLYEVIHG